MVCKIRGLESAVTKEFSSRYTKMLKLGNHMEGSGRSIDGFSNLVDQCRRRVPEESRSLVKVSDVVGFQPHQSRAGRIGSHWIVREYDLSEKTRAAVKGAVAFHGHNAVCDNEVDRNRGAYIKDALLNAFPMEKTVLGHPYPAPGTTPNMFFMLRVTPDQ